MTPLVRRRKNQHHAGRFDLDPAVYRDLLGRTDLDCWGLASAIFTRCGQTIGFDAAWADQWVAVPGPQAGALALLGPNHVAVCVSASEAIHVRSGAAVDVVSIRALQRAGKVTGYFLHSGRVELPTFAPADPTTVRAIHLPDPVRDPTRRDFCVSPWAPGQTVGGLAPPGATAIVTATGPRPLDEHRNDPVDPGQTVVYVTAPGDPATIISLIIAVVSAVLSVALAPSLPRPANERDDGSPSFSLDGLRNTSSAGIVQPVLYGSREVGGNFIGAHQRIGDDGRAELFLLMFISRGPIKSIGGLTADADELYGDSIPDTIYIDGNAAKNYDCFVSVRLGHRGQTVIPGFSELISAFAQTPTLDDGQPFTYETTQPVDGFDLEVSYPTGLYDIDSGNGDTTVVTVNFTVRWRVLGATVWLSEPWTNAAAARSPRKFQFRKRGLARNRYEVQIERTTAWPPSGSAQMQSVLTAVQEVVSAAFSYPGKALLAMRIRATEQLAGGFPTVSCVAEGRLIYIWDGVSTTNPAFGATEVYTTNPSHCMMDWLTNPQYGGGRNGRIKLDNINLDHFRDWSEACDDLVSDGRGGTIKRAECNLLIDGPSSLYETFTAVALSAWARPYRAGDKINLVLDAFVGGAAPTVPHAVFGLGNSRSMRFDYRGRSVRPNVVEVQFPNAETNWDADVTQRVNVASLFTAGDDVVKDSLQAIGVTSAAQAARLAQYRANYYALVTDAVALIGGPDSVTLLPGDLFIAHGAGVHDGSSGRTRGAGASTITLDRALVVTAAPRVRIYVISEAGDAVESAYIATGSYAAGAAITVTTAAGGAFSWTVQPVAGTRWAVESLADTAKTRLYRTTKIVSRGLEREIEGDRYDPDVYDDDPGEVEEFTDVRPNVRAIPTAAAVTAYEAQVKSYDGSTIDQVVIEFTATERWHRAEVWFRKGLDDPWSFLAWARERYVFSPAACDTDYEFAVVLVSAAGTRQRIEDAGKARCHVRGWRTAPLAPTAVAVAVIAGTLTVRTTGADDPTVAGFEIRYGTHRAGSVLLARSVSGEWSGPCPFVGTETIRVSALSRNGVHSFSEATASATNTLPTAIYTTDVSSNEHAAWGGTKTNTSVTGSELQLSGSNLTGTYQTPDKTTAITKQLQEIRIRVRAEIADTQATWDDCTHPWADSSWTWDTWFLRGDEIEAAQRRSTWDSWGWAWDSMPGRLLTWDGGVDVLAGLTPLIEYDVNTGSGFSGSWTTYSGPVTVANLTGVRTRVTLRRPDTRFDPRLVELTTTTAVVGSSEPMRQSVHFHATNAIAKGITVRGFGTSTLANVGIEVPTGYKLSILRIEGRANVGATAGTTRVNFGVYCHTDAAFTSCVQGSAIENSPLFARATGTRAAPLATLAAGKVWALGIQNDAGSASDLANTVQFVECDYVYEPV